MPVELNPSILTRTVGSCQSPAWKRELARAFTAVEPLLAFVGVRTDEVPDLDPDHQRFGLLVPRGFAARVTRGDAADPLLRQVLPLGSERVATDGFSLDPVGDASALRAPGLLQKYSGRALLLVSRACAVHCRYCFRRHYPYSGPEGLSARADAAVEEIARDPGISELILSGGDPLMLDDPELGALLGRIDGIAHLRRLRIHTRLPVVLPARVTQGLCDLLGSLRATTSVVIHANHPAELCPATAQALGRLRATGPTLLNQSVLLRGVNDRAEILSELSERLFDCGVLPYYLHQLDPVAGAAHFEVPDDLALGLMESLRQRIPGYLVPRLVREIPGEPCKRALEQAPRQP